ncbi:MAG: hypothetical protein ACE5I2_13350 [Anaerolineae bacterium]
MTTASYVRRLLERAVTVLPVSDEEIILKGITNETVERIVCLKKVTLRLQISYGSLEALEQRVKTEGVSPNDHTLYTDLLEWRAIRHEMAELVSLLEAV